MRIILRYKSSILSLPIPLAIDILRINSGSQILSGVSDIGTCMGTYLHRLLHNGLAGNPPGIAVVPHSIRLPTDTVCVAVTLANSFVFVVPVYLPCPP